MRSSSKDMAAKKIAVEICKQWYLERCSAKGAGVERSRPGGGESTAIPLCAKGRN